MKTRAPFAVSLLPLFIVWVGSFTLLLGGQAIAQGQTRASPSNEAEVVAQYNVMVPMRDGVRLSTDVYRPKGEGRYPTVLTRNPYSNGSGGIKGAKHWAARGYALVIQDVRGRYDSDGKFYPYVNDANDGHDLLEWIARQPWSNGKVGMTGGSYMGSVQWLAALQKSPALVTIIPEVAPFDYYKDAVYPGGAFSLAARLEWISYMGGRTAQEGPFDLDRLHWHLPLKTMGMDAGMDLPVFRDWVAHPSHDDYWRRFDVQAQVGNIDLPVLHIGGWFDAFLSGTLSSYQAMRTSSPSAASRAHQQLLIGPWHHRLNRGSKTGDIEFGAQATIDLSKVQVPWLDHWLQGKDNGVMEQAPVRIFVMGDNRWRDEQEWPLARTRYTKYYLHAGGDKSAAGGALDTSQPRGGKASASYVYDPNNPVPTLGGGLLPIALGPGPRDQSPLSQRTDILSFSTAPLERDTEVTGPLQVTLYASSSAPDTDFTAKLIDVHPDGKAYNFADGIIRARYRESFKEPRLIEPGKVYEYTINLVATSNVFKRGHRIRVDISSSNFPRFDRNPNTGHAFGEDAELKPATQTIFYTRKYPSHITLPIIPRDAT